MLNSASAGWNKPDATLQDFLEDQVACSPDASAILCGNENLTYYELNSRVNQLAHFLRNRGVGSDSVVGICTHRSIEMIVGILGILKSGGTYLPLDPNYPQERLSFILQDSGTQLVLTQSNLSGFLPENEIQTICIDQNWQEISTFSTENPEKISSPDNLAYIIYTSGSTGKPKGVMITHSNVYHFVKIASSALDIHPKDKYLQTASIAYALSVRQLMVPISLGAALVMATSEEIRDPLALFELIKEQNVTLMDMVPSFWRTCIQRLSDISSDERTYLLDNQLRRIVTVGEPLYSDIPHDWRNKLGHPAVLVNIFGQTETTGIVAAYPIPAEPQTPAGIVPVGKSVLGTRLYILDANLLPVPEGELGELCVSNPCIAKGYLNRPELTEAKFIPNPFLDGCSDRLYRTGDMARFGEDGNIQFLGRGDHQVKIRGQRLELSEIEVVLRQHSDVQDCAVVARGEKPDDKYLAAFIVPFENRNLASRELRAFLKNHLPDYMIPSLFVFLDKLPMTPNGKLDRLSLPDPRKLTASKERNFYLGPRNNVEQTITKIWQELLAVELIGVHDDFFDLGGHSFLAVRLFSRIEQDLGIRLPLTTLFHATTVAQISTLIDDQIQSEMSWSPIVPVQILGDKPPFFGVHGHEGGVLFWRYIVYHLPDDQPFYAIQARGVDGFLPALTSIEEMARLYVSEIRKIQPHGPYYLGGYSMGGTIAYEMGQQLIQSGERVNLLVMLDTQNPKRVQASVRDDVKPGQPDKKKFMKKENKLFRPLTGLTIKERMGYLKHVIQYRVERQFVYFRVGVLRFLKERLPDDLLLSYLKFAHSQGMHSYIPNFYPGKVTLFRASESLDANPDDSQLSWKTLTDGNFEVFYFNATHNIINAEYAKEVAGQLMECLSRSFLA